MLCSNYVSDKTFVLLKEINLRNSKFVVISNFYFDTGPAPRGGIPGPCPPKQKSPPPSKDCSPKKLTGSRLLECKSRPKLVFATGIFVTVFLSTDTVFHDSCGMKIFFCLEITCFRPEKLLEFLISAGKSL